MRIRLVAWNIFGLGVPLAIALVSVPILVKNLGAERFGLLALFWGISAIGGIMDGGVGRAATRQIAVQLGKRRLRSIPRIASTAVTLAAIVGAFGAVLVAGSAMFVSADALQAASVSTGEIQIAVVLVAATIPAQSIGAVYRGVNEAYLKFSGISIVRICLGVVNFIGPVVVSKFTQELPWIVLSLCVGRVMGTIAFRTMALSTVAAGPERRHRSSHRVLAKSLISFGSWMTVSGIVSPLLTQLDRFVIAFLISATAVTVYVLPYELITKTLVLVSAVTAVAFPALGAMMQAGTHLWRQDFLRWLGIVAVGMTVVCGFLGYFLPTILSLWLDVVVEPRSIDVGRILCIGVVFNAIGSMYFSLLHALGRADITAKIHLLEVPLYVCALFFLTHSFGVVGAAWAWVARMAVDMILLIATSRRYA